MALTHQRGMEQGYALASSFDKTAGAFLFRDSASALSRVKNLMISEQWFFCYHGDGFFVNTVKTLN